MRKNKPAFKIRLCFSFPNRCQKKVLIIHQRLSCSSEDTPVLPRNLSQPATPQISGNAERPQGSLEFKSNQFRRVPSMFYYQQFHKAVWINKAAVSLNYQYIKMYLWTTKDCLTELLFSALFQRENWGDSFKRLTLKM